MLAHDGIILLEAELLGLGARVLLGHIEEAGVGRADELDLDGGRLCHDPKFPNRLKKQKRRPAPPLFKRRPMAQSRCDVNLGVIVTSASPLLNRAWATVA